MGGGDASLEQWAELAEAKGSVQTCIRRFIGEEEGGQPHKPKSTRQATKCRLKALDNALKQVTGKGLESFVGPDSPFKPALRPLREALAEMVPKVPHGLALVADQGSTGLAGLCFLLHHHGLCVEMLMDPPPAQDVEQ